MMGLDEDAAKYVEMHGLEDHLSAAVDAAIKAKADDPLTFISNFLRPHGEPMPLHTKARSQDNPDYPDRHPVTDAKVRWTAVWPDYQPPQYTHQIVKANNRDLPTGHKWADPEDAAAIKQEVSERKTFCRGGEELLVGAAVDFDHQGRPMNPVGRTGIAGRGLLGRWGPNHAADPIVTRHDPKTGRFQVVAIQRKDTGHWALPGGMVDPGEQVTVTVRREFGEEAGSIEDPEEQQRFKQMTDELFTSGRQVYRGYVDDPRNTDHAWMETTAFHMHCTHEIGDKLPLKAGDDAGQVMWLDVDVSNPKYSNLYASHRIWVDKVAAEMGKWASLCDWR